MFSLISSFLSRKIKHTHSHSQTMYFSIYIVKIVRLYANHGAAVVVVMYVVVHALRLSLQIYILHRMYAESACFIYTLMAPNNSNNNVEKLKITHRRRVHLLPSWTHYCCCCCWLVMMPLLLLFLLLFSSMSLRWWLVCLSTIWYRFVCNDLQVNAKSYARSNHQTSHIFVNRLFRFYG